MDVMGNLVQEAVGFELFDNLERFHMAILYSCLRVLGTCGKAVQVGGINKVVFLYLK